jgi:uncharacterized Ntn-hydrolase superfamily protein
MTHKNGKAFGVNSGQVQGGVLGVGAIVPFAKAGVGAIATQSKANTTYGPEGLKLLAAGKSAEETMKSLTGADKDSANRQVGILPAKGAPATFTGSGCTLWAGGRTGTDYTAQGNILAGQAVGGATSTSASTTTPNPSRNSSGSSNCTGKSSAVRPPGTRSRRTGSEKDAPGLIAEGSGVLQALQLCREDVRMRGR